MKIRNEKSDIRNFGIGLTVFLIIIGSYRFYHSGQLDNALWFYGIGGASLFLSLLAPWVLKPLYKLVTKIAHKIGWVNTRLLLGIIFYLLITPIAVVFKLIGKDPLDRKIEAEKKSYWIPRKESSIDAKRYEQQF